MSFDDIVTIEGLTADELVELEFKKRRKKNAKARDLEDDTNYVIPLLKLASGVTPADYPALKAGMEAVTGIQEVSGLIAHRTKAGVPADHTQVLGVRADITLRDDTSEP